MKDEVKEITKPIFILPLCARIISDNSYFHKYTKYMELDNVGFDLLYDEIGQEDNPDWIRKHLQLRESTETLIEADDLESAIFKFHNEWDGAKIGGPGETQKALWIDRSRSIIEIPNCQNMRMRVLQCDVICGDPEDYGYCGCVFSHFDPPEEGCIGSKFYEAISSDIVDGKWVDRILPEICLINGLEYKYLTWKQITGFTNDT